MHDGERNPVLVEKQESAATETFGIDTCCGNSNDVDLPNSSSNKGTIILMNATLNQNIEGDGNAFGDGGFIVFDCCIAFKHWKVPILFPKILESLLKVLK